MMFKMAYAKSRMADTRKKRTAAVAAFSTTSHSGDGKVSTSCTVTAHSSGGMSLFMIIIFFQILKIYGR